MRSAAAAFGWEFRQRLRWGVLALGSYLLLLSILQILILGPRSPINPLRSTTLAFVVLVPLTAAFMYFLAVFSYGLTGDLIGRASLYPSRLFTLPVSTRALAGWPMFYGTITLAVLWLAAALLALRPSGVSVPLVWPALFCAAFVAWLQVFAWMPYGLPALRIIAAVLWLMTFDAVAMLAMEYKLDDAWMIGIMAPQIPLAYLAACYALKRARCGDTPDWRFVFTALGRIGDLLPRRRASFASPVHALASLEWRQHGRSLPFWVAILAPFAVLYLYAVRNEPPALTLIGLAGMMVAPPFLAAFVALTVGRTASFTNTRPLSTVVLVSVKFRTALISALVAWFVVLVAASTALTIARSWPVVIERARQWLDFFGPPRAAVLGLLAVVLLVTATWKQLVQGLAIGLTGREGVVKASVIARLWWLVMIGLAVHFLTISTDARIALWNGVRWIPAALVLVKMGAAGWVVTRLARERLLDDRQLVAATAAWLAVVLALYGLFAWFFDNPYIPHDVLLLLAVLAVPLARPALVPLALSSSRHGGSREATGDSRPPRAAFALLATPALLASAFFVSYESENRDNGSFVSSGEERSYRLYVPKSYDRTRATPLVISLHGGALWGAAQMRISGWNAVADEKGFLVVYPSGRGGRGPRAWRAGNGGNAATDVRFIGELIDILKASHNVDPARIYADGLSNGGGMALVLSCTLPDRIAAIGVVAAAVFRTWSDCEDPRPVPMIAFHGIADRLARYQGGESWVASNHRFPSIPDWVAGWARRNQCNETPVESAVAPDVTRRAYQGCASGADVAFFIIQGGGHTWPGGDGRPRWFAGETTRSIDASREMWKFFESHPLRR